jgi:hypothetical protein
VLINKLSERERKERRKRRGGKERKGLRSGTGGSVVFVVVAELYGE